MKNFDNFENCQGLIEIEIFGFLMWEKINYYKTRQKDYNDLPDMTREIDTARPTYEDERACIWSRRSGFGKHYSEMGSGGHEISIKA